MSDWQLISTYLAQHYASLHDAQAVHEELGAAERQAECSRLLAELEVLLEDAHNPDGHLALLLQVRCEGWLLGQPNIVLNQ